MTAAKPEPLVSEPCDKCGQPFSHSNIAAHSPTCEECLVADLEKYPFVRGTSGAHSPNGESPLPKSEE